MTRVEETAGAGVSPALAAELAGLSGVVARLLQLHRSDGAGRCRACTTPGTGQPGARWPCRLHAYALQASGLGTPAQVTACTEDAR